MHPPCCSLVCTYWFLYQVEWSNRPAGTATGPSIREPKHYNPRDKDPDVSAWIEKVKSLCDTKKIPDTGRPQHAMEYIHHGVRRNFQDTYKKLNFTNWSEFTRFMNDFDSRWCLIATFELFDQSLQNFIRVGLPFCTVQVWFALMKFSLPNGVLLPREPNK